MQAWILGSGGWIPTRRRATTSVLVRDAERALVVDLGTGVAQLMSDPLLLEGAKQLDVVITHFHLDHVCGIAYLPALPLRATLWAPGRWLYRADSREVLRPFLSPPLSPFELDERPLVRELCFGSQIIGGFNVTTRAQLRHWAPSAGLRIGEDLAVVTDTGYDEGSVELARGVRHLLHEAWSTSSQPSAAPQDATGADAGKVAAAASVNFLTLMHLNPLMSHHQEVLEDAQRHFPTAQLAEDGTALEVSDRLPRSGDHRP